MGDKVLLVSMPWQPYYLASTQLAALKSYLSECGIDDVFAEHWYLDVAHALGFDTFNRISKPHLDYGEALYSSLAFPTMREALLTDDALIQHFDAIRKNATDSSPSLPLRWNKSFLSDFRALHGRLFDRYDWSEFSLVGFTLNYGQTVASLYAAREIKRRNPNCRVIIGGAEATGIVGASLVRHFREFDYACNGEGELPLLELVTLLRANGGSPERSEIVRIRGLICEDDDGALVQNPPNQVANLSTLPIPDYDDYFQRIESFNVPQDEVVSCLPIEGSRGCYHGCTFCALTAQWEGFRTYGSEQVSETIDTLASRYKILEFFFVDNITPTNVHEIFERIAQSNRDYSFFYEARANLPRETFERMKKAGLQRVQIGIEALSASLLKKLRKKARVIHNIQAMKNCEELEILMSANLITNHFLSSQQDIDETLEVIEYCTAYFPPNGISDFALVVGAPDYEEGQSRGYQLLGNADFYRRNWPESLFNSLELPIKEFEPIDDPVDWVPVEQRIQDWKQEYFAFKDQNPTNCKMLCYYDGGHFLRIEDYRAGLESTLVLNEIQRDIYLFAIQTKHYSMFQRAFKHLAPGLLQSTLDDFVFRKLMYRENDSYLSLAMTPTPRFMTEDAKDRSLSNILHWITH